MIPIHTVFGGLLVLFALIGSLRGWAKEMIVAFSVILALFVEHVLLTFVPPIKVLYDNLPGPSRFYTRAVLFSIITVFGYASPTVVAQLGAKVARERLQDLLLGFFLGLINGFLVVGTLLSFLNAVNYGVLPDQPAGTGGIGGIVPPASDSPAVGLIGFLPPEMIAKSNAALYISVAAAFVFVIVVFI
jgi:uncharacterized membrane protein required for colicin V production